MKQALLIVSFLMVSGVAFADSTPQAAVLVKTTSQQRAATELISARIKSALDGKAYTLVAACDDVACKSDDR